MGSRKRKVHASGQTDLNREKLPTLELPDKIPEDCHTLIVGFGPGKESAKTGHYYPGANNYMWKLLHRSGIMSEFVKEGGDDAMVAMGFGFTDVVKRPTDGPIQATHAEMMDARPRLLEMVGELDVKVVVFVGLEAIRTYLRKPQKNIEYGIQRDLELEDAIIFVVPSTSGASVASTIWEEKLDAFDELKRLLDDLGLL